MYSILFQTVLFLDKYLSIQQGSDEIQEKIFLKLSNEGMLLAFYLMLEIKLSDSTASDVIHGCVCVKPN